MKRLVAIIAVAALFFSCVKEVVEPGMRISGTYAYWDGTGLSNQYVSFDNGYFSQVVLSKSLSYMEDSFWGYSKSYETVYKKPYSIRDGNLIVAGQSRGVVELKEDYLYLQGKKYSKVKTFNKELYSSIVLPEGTAKTISYESKEYAVPVTINRPIPTGTLNTSTTASWISGIKVQDGYLKFSASETKVDRTATIGLFYTNADEVTLSISQRPSTFIKLGEHERTVAYSQSSQSISYTIENPLPGSALDVSCTSNWVKNIVVGAESVTFDVDEHPGSSSRIATLIGSYSGAADVSFALTQSGAVTTIVPSPTSQSCTYTGGAFSFDFTIENPRQGIEVAATSQNDWITDVAIEGNTVSYKVEENNSGTSRTGRIRLAYGDYATKNFYVYQSWSSSSITLTPSSQDADYTGGSFSFTYAITNPREGVTVTAASQNDWITDVAISGNTVRYKAAENNSGIARVGKVRLSYGNYATKDFTVNQSWSSSEISLTPASQNTDYTDGSFSFTYAVINPREGATVTASSQNDWITDVAISGNTVNYKVEENNSGVARTGRIRLAYGDYALKDFIISQTWSAPEITTNPTSQGVIYTGGDFSFDIFITNPREGITLTASSQSDWIKNIIVSGNRVSYRVSENNSGSTRVGIIKIIYGTFITKDFNISQSWSSSDITTTPISQDVIAAGGIFSLDCLILNPREGITLTASSQSNWITGVSVYGSTVSYKVAENNFASARIGIVRLSYGSYTTKDFTVNQSGKPVQSLSLNKNSLALLTGNSETLVATVDPTDAHLQWSSDNSLVATVNQSGVVSAVGNGTAMITVSAENGKSASCAVTVTTAVTGITLNKTSLTLVEGTQEQLTATISPSTASDKSVTWSSGNELVAMVDQSGKVMAVAKGTATIKATANDGSGKSASCTVTVLGVNLSANGSANCYVVSSAGDYFFSATKGNSDISVGSVSSVSVLWESYGTSTTPSVGSIINNVSYSSNTITFSTPSTLKNGNAVIAAKDASGNVLWSWHIWVCKDYDPAATAQTYYNNAGVMMDRNLGATSATPGDVGALGLMYQWGRKDPFLGSSSISSGTKAKSTLSTWPSPVSSNSSTGKVAYAVAHPTTFITGVSGTNNDWVFSSRDNTLWKSTKTIYDPCPPGWKVPAGGSSGVWSKAANTSSSFSYTWDSTNKGMNFSNKFGSAGTIWYPAAGSLRDVDGSLLQVGSYGYWWSCTPRDYYAYRLRLGSEGNVNPSDYSYRANGRSVRCLQE